MLQSRGRINVTKQSTKRQRPEPICSILKSETTIFEFQVRIHKFMDQNLRTGNENMQPFKPKFSYSVRKWEQIRIKGPDKYLARSLFAKIVNVF